MDKVGADFYHVVRMVEERLQAKPLPIGLPLGVENLFRGVIDLVENKAITFPDDPDLMPVVESIPESDRAIATEYREKLIEKLAESDNQIMQMYLEGQDIPVSLLKAAIRRATIANQVVPVLCGSALRGKGIRPLLDAVADYLPSPLDIPPIPATRLSDGAEIACRPNDKDPFAALVFKTVSDPFMGRLSYLRVYSGEVKAGAQVLNSTTGYPDTPLCKAARTPASMA
ncbi:unnamed protein product [marine sediment metagenome]|uniref:Tr-type G domain-containing protein n=1 Tax=marine sediment metagenome TaxID=412755 RepID=X1MUB9_9ZZZZ